MVPLVIDQSYAPPPKRVALAAADAPVVSSVGATMVMVGQVPMFVAAEEPLFDEFASAVEEWALTVNCTAPAAEGATFHSEKIVACCPELSGPMLQGKLATHAPPFPLNVSPGDAVAVTATLLAVSGPAFETVTV